MAIMTQVHVGRARLALFRREVATAADYNDTQQQLLHAIRSERDANKVSEQTLLREELNAAVGRVRLGIAKAGLETAKANLVSSMGLDPAGEAGSETSTVAEIASALRGSGSTASIAAQAPTSVKLED